MPGTLVLDLDGTLLDGSVRQHRCYSDILARHGYDALPLAEYWDMKRQRLNRRVQLEKTGAGALYEIFLEEWLRDIEGPGYLALDVPHPGVRERLSEWKTDGFELVLATLRQNPINLERQLEDLGLRVFFNEILVSPHAEGAAGKAAGLLATRQDPSETLWVGDTEVDIAAARAVGCRVWAVACGIRTREYLSTLKPDFLSDSFLEVDPHV
jgi:phosphoglycolate phosphatase